MDGLLGLEAEATLKCIISRLITKCKQPRFLTCRYVNGRVDITLVRATNHCIPGYQVQEHKIIIQIPLWEDGTGLHLLRKIMHRKPKINGKVYFMHSNT